MTTESKSVFLGSNLTVWGLPSVNNILSWRKNVDKQIVASTPTNNECKTITNFTAQNQMLNIFYFIAE